MVRAANEKSNSFYFGLAVCVFIGGLLIHHDLGVIAFALFVLVGIFGFGLRDKFSNETTASAYSVFNEDGKAIVGGFTASQFENQLRGPMGRRNHEHDPVKGRVAQSLQTKEASTTLSDAERIARRRAAAAAAERRLQSSKED